MLVQAYKYNFTCLGRCNILAECSLRGAPRQGRGSVLLFSDPNLARTLSVAGRRTTRTRIQGLRRTLAERSVNSHTVGTDRTDRTSSLREKHKPQKLSGKQENKQTKTKL